MKSIFTEHFNLTTSCPVVPLDFKNEVIKDQSLFIELDEKEEEEEDTGNESGNDVDVTCRGLKSVGAIRNHRAIVYHGSNQHHNYHNQTKPASASPDKQYKIRMMTREKDIDASIHADEFIKNREAAMKKVTSSRYGGKLKFNFGGYVPAGIAHTNEKKTEETMNILDYLKYVNRGAWDFVLHVILDERADAMARKRQQEEMMKRKNEEEKRKLYDEYRQQQLARRRQLSEFKDGYWNPGILEYLEEVKDRDTYKILELKNSNSSSNNLRKSNIFASKNAIHKRSKSRSLKVSLTEIENDFNIRTDSMVDLFQMQKNLEDLWKNLKMPTELKTEMAIKYSSISAGIKLEQSLELWKLATKHVLDREMILEKLERFEREASDPQRFFEEKDSAVRMEESKIRERYLEELKQIENLLKPLIEKLKQKGNEVLTYEGVPYAEKMKRDYLNLILKLKDERKQTIKEEKKSIPTRRPHTSNI